MKTPRTISSLRMTACAALGAVMLASCATRDDSSQAIAEARALETRRQFEEDQARGIHRATQLPEGDDAAVLGTVPVGQGQGQGQGQLPPTPTSPPAGAAPSTDAAPATNRTPRPQGRDAVERQPVSPLSVPVSR